MTITDIGTGSAALNCTTTYYPCCFSGPPPGTHWYFPNETRLENNNALPYYRSRTASSSSPPGSVILHRNAGATTTGIFWCDMRDANGTFWSVYVGIYTATTGEPCTLKRDKFVAIARASKHECICNRIENAHADLLTRQVLHQCNNSVVIITDIGTGSGALLCTTTYIPCCFSTPSPGTHWYFPNGVCDSNTPPYYRSRNERYYHLCTYTPFKNHTVWSIETLNGFVSIAAELTHISAIILN